MISCGSLTAGKAAEAASLYSQKAASLIRERYDQMDDMVRHYPAQSVVAAFGMGLAAGVVIGLALRSR